MCKPNFIKFDRLELLGVLSERSIILYALISDRLSWTKFRDADGVPFCYFTIEEVADIFKISQTQAKQAFKELETARLIIRRRSGQGKPSKIFQTDGKPPAIDDNISSCNISSSSSENCENQQTFDDLFLEMTTKDAVSKIVAEIVSENSDEFAEITAKIADFVAENVRNAMRNQKIRNIRAYVRACLAHAKSDYDATQTDNSGYGATYDIAAYENYSAADSPEWND